MKHEISNQIFTGFHSVIIEKQNQFSFSNFSLCAMRPWENIEYCLLMFQIKLLITNQCFGEYAHAYIHIIFITKCCCHLAKPKLILLFPPISICLLILRNYVNLVVYSIFLISQVCMM